jgi:hypothetical protein
VERHKAGLPPNGDSIVAKPDHVRTGIGDMERSSTK